MTAGVRWLVVLCLVAAAACGGGEEAGGTPGHDPEGTAQPRVTPETVSDESQAPPFQVTGSEGVVSVPPFTFCWTEGSTGLCADGVPAPEEHVIPVAGQVSVSYVDGELAPHSGEEQAQDHLPFEETGPGEWVLDVQGLGPGEHTVWLFWTGEQGDSSTAFTVVM